MKTQMEPKKLVLNQETLKNLNNHRDRPSLTLTCNTCHTVACTVCHTC